MKTLKLKTKGIPPLAVRTAWAATSSPLPDGRQVGILCLPHEERTGVKTVFCRSFAGVLLTIWPPKQKEEKHCRNGNNSDRYACNWATAAVPKTAFTQWCASIYAGYFASMGHRGIRRAIGKPRQRGLRVAPFSVVHRRLPTDKYCLQEEK